MSEEDVVEEHQPSLSLAQIKALISALEECGFDSGAPLTELEYFRSTQMVTAAKAAYLVLQAKRQRIEGAK
jgi:hypothetical protein